MRFRTIDGVLPVLPKKARYTGLVLPSRDNTICAFLGKFYFMTWETLYITKDIPEIVYLRKDGAKKVGLVPTENSKLYPNRYIPVYTTCSHTDKDGKLKVGKRYDTFVKAKDVS